MGALGPSGSTNGLVGRPRVPSTQAHRSPVPSGLPQHPPTHERSTQVEVSNDRFYEVSEHLGHMVEHTKKAEIRAGQALHDAIDEIERIGKCGPGIRNARRKRFIANDVFKTCRAAYERAVARAEKGTMAELRRLGEVS